MAAAAKSTARRANQRWPSVPGRPASFAAAVTRDSLSSPDRNLLFPERYALPAVPQARFRFRLTACGAAGTISAICSRC